MRGTAVAAGHAKRALVVVSDALVPGLGTASETTCGAGCRGHRARPGRRSARGAPRPGRRGRCLSSTATGPTALQPAATLTTRGCSAKRCTCRVMSAVAKAVAGSGPAVSSHGDRTPVAAWSFADPDGKLASVLAKRLGAPAPLSVPVQTELGDTGAASALLGVVPSLAEAGTVGAIGYGGGRATAVAVQVDHPVPGADGRRATARGRPPDQIHRGRALDGA